MIGRQTPDPYEASGPSGLTEDSVDWHHYLRLLRERWRVIAAATALCLVAAVVHFLITPKSYRATTTLQIEQRSSMAVTADPNPWLEAWIGMKYYPTQYRLLESRGLAERVVLDLGLMDDPVFNSAPRRLLGGPETAEMSAAADEAVLAQLANQVLAGVSVDPIKDTELVQVSFVGSDAKLASRIANGVADAFIDWGIETRTATVGRASEFLGKQIETLKDEINEKEGQLQSYGRSTDILNLDPQSNVTLQQLDRLNEDFIEALGSRLEKEARYNEFKQSPADALANRESGGLVNELQREQLKLEADYETRLRTYKPEWPEMVDLKARIDDGRKHLGGLIDEQARKARGAAQAEYQTALRREQSLQAEIARVKDEAMDRNASAVEFRNLEMEIQNRRKLLEEMLRRLSEAGVRARLQTERETNMRVIDRALTPRSPFRPSLFRNLPVGLVLGIGLGVALVLLAQLMDRSVKNATELQQRLGLPVLTVVPDLDFKGGAARYGYYEAVDRPRSVDHAKVARIADRAEAPDIELIPELNPRSAVSEAYRSLRTALLLSSAEDLRMIAVTSPESGDGKTATAVNLAVVMAQLGRRTLLVDGDLRRPRLHTIFDQPNSAGLVHILVGSAEPRSVYLETPVKNLMLCPSGPHPPNPSELLGSERMGNFLTRASVDFDLVVVDTPPALVVTDAVVIGAQCNGMILCLHANKTLREDAESCAERLRMGGIRILGAVLNRFRPVAGDSYSRRYYSYEAYSEKPDRAQGVGRLTRARVAACLAAALLACPALGGAVHPFYANLLEDGVRSYQQGDYSRAREELRIAAFGLLESPEELARALAHLALAQRAGGDGDGFETSYRRLTELENRFSAYSSAALRADVRGALDQAAGKPLGTDALASERPATEPATPKAESAAPATVATIARPQVCISWTGDGKCGQLEAAASPRPTPTPEALASFDRLQRLSTERASDKKLRSGFAEARELADRYPDWAEMQRVAGVLASRSGSYADAVRFYDRAGEPTEEGPLQLFYLSIALFETDQVEEAATVLRRVLPTLRHNREVRKYMKRILNEESAG